MFPTIVSLWGQPIGSLSSDLELGIKALSEWLVSLAAYIAKPAPSAPQMVHNLLCGCSAVLFPLVVTVYVTWWFLTFFDNFFSVRLIGSMQSASF